MIILLTAASLTAQTFKKTSTSGFVFLEIPVSARSAALGECAIALSDQESQSIFTNPAGLGFMEQQQSFSASYSPWFADIKHFGTGYSFTSDFGVFGIGVDYVDFGTFDKTIRQFDNRVFNVIGTFGANAAAFSLAYSSKLTDRFSFGLTGKYVKETIDIYSADNILFDGGILYYTGLGSLRIAASLQNFGVSTQYRTDPFKMPSVLKLGAAAEVLGGQGTDYRLTAIAEALHPNDNNERLNTGLEFSYMDMITLRGGYKFFYDEEKLSFGIGVKASAVYPVAVDFSLSDYGRLGNIMRFTLQAGLK